MHGERNRHLKKGCATCMIFSRTHRKSLPHGAKVRRGSAKRRYFASFQRQRCAQMRVGVRSRDFYLPHSSFLGVFTMKRLYTSKRLLATRKPTTHRNLA